jgi:hypothetical protein
MFIGFALFKGYSALRKDAHCSQASLEILHRKRCEHAMRAWRNDETRR